MNFDNFLSKLAFDKIDVIDISIQREKYVKIDLSDKNSDLQKFNISSSKEWEDYISTYLRNNNAEIAYGGYLEKRSLYQRSEYFNTRQIRNVHLGIDFWCKVGTGIIAPMRGEIHSFKNNLNYGDYGPTIILKHTIQSVKFYTLYGHLGVDSITNLKVGQTIEKGEKFASLGSSDINGDYAPHLHFQVIKNIQNFVGDYPGVCSETDLDFYKLNCPDPNILLKL